MSLLSNEVKAKIVETKTLEANITIGLLLDMICKHWENCLDNYYIMESEPELSTDNYSDSVTINLNSSDKVNISHVIDDVRILFEEELEKHIRKEEDAIIANIKDKVAIEEGENGSL